MCKRVKLFLRRTCSSRSAPIGPDGGLFGSTWVLLESFRSSLGIRLESSRDPLQCHSRPSWWAPHPHPIVYKKTQQAIIHTQSFKCDSFIYFVREYLSPAFQVRHTVNTSSPPNHLRFKRKFISIFVAIWTLDLSTFTSTKFSNEKLQSLMNYKVERSY